MGLSPLHRRMLENGSGITPAVIASRGYETITDASQLETLGFGASQRRVPGLLVPIYASKGTLALHQYRPDSPRVGGRGKAVKYETPKGASLRIDVPPSALDALRDPSIPLYITEGSKKADCAVGHGLCCVALMGVYGYRGRRLDGSTGELDDWDDIPLDGRDVRLAFDSDVAIKPQVKDALDGLSKMLSRRGAKVSSVDFPHPKDGKVGLDDWFVTGGTSEGLDDLTKRFSCAVDGKSESILQRWEDFMMESDEVAWLVEGLLPSEGTSVLIAQPKVGKTTIVYWLANCVLKGIPFLGRRVDKGGVVLLLAEGSKPMHRKGLSRASLDRHLPLYVYAGSFAVGFEKIRQDILRIEPRPKLIVADTLFKLLKPNDGNDYAPMVKIMEAVTDLAREMGAHVLCTHHASKASFDGAGIGARSLGSTAIYGAVDTTISLQLRADRRSVSSEQRWGEPLPETDWSLDKETGEVFLSGSSAERQDTVVRERILAALADGPLQEKEIKNRVTNKSASAALRRLVEMDEVRRKGEGKKNDPYFYSLPTHAFPQDADSGFSFSPLDKEEPETTIETVR